jgi:hypothetical protein
MIAGIVATSKNLRARKTIATNIQYSFIPPSIAHNYRMSRSENENSHK